MRLNVEKYQDRCHVTCCNEKTFVKWRFDVEKYQNRCRDWMKISLIRTVVATLLPLARNRSYNEPS